MDQNICNMYPLVVGAQTDVLRAVAQPIRSLDKEMRILAKHLVELMWLYDRVGLAAPQI